MNQTRMNFLEEFQRIVDEYNAGAASVEAFFAKLMALAMRLKEEEKRGIAENLTEEELVVFDLPTKPEVGLSKKDEVKVKKAAKGRLETLKGRSWCWIGGSSRRRGRWCGTRLRWGWRSCRRCIRRRCISRSAMCCTGNL